jgi:membrane-associated phospholipid phosphatase
VWCGRADAGSRTADGLRQAHYYPSVVAKVGNPNPIGPPLLIPARPVPRRPPNLILPAALITAFALLAALVVRQWSDLTAFDRDRVLELNRYDRHHAVFLDVMRVVSVVASTAGWSVVLGLAAVCLARHRQWRTLVFGSVAAIGSPLVNLVLKSAVHRPRPVLDHPVQLAGGWSFPSGHVQAATVGCAVLLTVFLPSLDRAASWWAAAGSVGVVAVVALSRVALGVHYPCDVAASVLCGGAWVLTVAWLILPREPTALTRGAAGSGSRTSGRPR